MPAGGRNSRLTAGAQILNSTGGTPLPNEGRLSGRIDHDECKARRAAGVPHFSSGPCAKRPGWTPQALTDAVLGRSHRSKPGKAKLKRAIDLTREVLQVPADYRIGIVPASDTGAVEMALWSLLGPRPVTMLAWESFGEGWVSDVVKQLKLKDVTVLGRPTASCPTSPRSIRQATSCSPGTAPLPACACPTPTGSPPTAQA